MHEDAPPSSKERNSGPRSSHVDSRPCTLRRSRPMPKSGTRNGLASWCWTTDWGTTRRSSSPGPASSDGLGSSTATSMPALRSISSRRSRALSVTCASSESRPKREGSRVAVLARMVAIPSRRLSSSAFCASVSAVDAFTSPRCSRTRSATTWNRTRCPGASGPRCTADSSSRTARASTGTMPSLSLWRAAAGVRRPPRERWRWAKVSLPDWVYGVAGEAGAGAPFRTRRRAGVERASGARWPVDQRCPVGHGVRTLPPL